MHGKSQTADSFLFIQGHSITTLVTPETKIILLTAPQRSITCDAGKIMHSWYDIRNDNMDLKIPHHERISYDDLQDSIRHINQIILKESDNFKGKIILAGFSQGCIMSLDVGLDNMRVNGILGFSGLLHSFMEMKNLCKIPIFLFHGSKDKAIPINIAVNSYEPILKEKNVKLFIENEGKHSINSKQMKLFKELYKETVEK